MSTATHLGRLFDAIAALVKQATPSALPPAMALRTRHGLARSNTTRSFAHTRPSIKLNTSCGTRTAPLRQHGHGTTGWRTRQDAHPGPAAASSMTATVQEEKSVTKSEETVADFVWTQNWWPVHVIDSADPSRPHAVRLLGKQLVLWRDGQGSWRCHEDACPHRCVGWLMPLFATRCVPAPAFLKPGICICVPTLAVTPCPSCTRPAQLGAAV